MSGQNNPSFFQSLRFRYGVGLLFFLAVAGYFLWEEHEAHILENSVLILIVGACVGMHLFMHGGHGHGRPLDGEGEGSANIDQKDGEK